MDYQELISKVDLGEQFSLSRWGDGEWYALLGRYPTGANCDNHKYFPSLGKALVSVLASSPEYYLGIQPLAKAKVPEDIQRFTTAYNLKWIDSSLLHRASIRGEMELLFNVLRDVSVLIVGPKHLENLSAFTFDHIVIPDLDCWLHFDAIARQIHTYLNSSGPLVILYCASMMSNVLIDEFAGQATQIDMGSVLDPYAGVKTRTYHHSLNLD
jgi:hypothetical protein